MESYLEEITPDKAKELLRTVKDNRSLVQNYVTVLARDMSAERWYASPQGLVLDDQGNVLDGQHRLSAVVRAGVPVKFWVTRGVPRNAFKYLDAGRSRSMADRLRISGYADSTQLAAITRKVFAWEKGQPWSYTTVASRDDLQETIDKNPLLLEAAKFAHAWRSPSRLAPATAAFAWWLFMGMAEEEASWFMERLRTGTELPVDSGVWAVHDRLSRDPERGKYMKPQLTVAYMITGWNAQRDGRPVKRLMFRNPLTNDNYPVPH
jgi:hypothetical protein